MSDEFTRRNLLRATATTAAAGIGVTGTAAAGGTDDDVRVTGPIPCRKFDATDLKTVSASEPLPETATGIQPGSQIFIEFPSGTTAGCTANFVWRQPPKTVEKPVEDDGPAADDASEEEESTEANETATDDEQETETVTVREERFFIGAAGHCFLPTSKNATKNAQRDGEKDKNVYTKKDELTVKICKNCNVGGITGLSVARGEVYELGDVVYARQNTPDGEEVGYDFGIVEIPEELYHAIDPSVPQFGGPIGYENGAVPQGETVCQYGAGVANGEVFPTMASRGVSEGALGTPQSWYAGIRASPGDSGSLLSEYEFGSGTDAAGILTHLTTVGVAGTTIPQCVAMTQKDVGIDLDLVLENGESVDVATDSVEG